MTYHIVKTSKCSTLSNKSDLTYHIGSDEEGLIQIRVLTTPATASSARSG